MVTDRIAPNPYAGDMEEMLEYRLDDLMRLYGLRPATIYAAIESGALDAVIEAGEVRIRPAALNAWLTTSALHEASPGAATGSESPKKPRRN